MLRQPLSPRESDDDERIKTQMEDRTLWQAEIKVETYVIMAALFTLLVYWNCSTWGTAIPTQRQ